MVVSSVDTIISLTHFPVTISFFNNRKPMLFEYYRFCIGWSICFHLLYMSSMFLVLLISISRTIAISRPFRPIKKYHYVLSYALFLVYCIIDIIAFDTKDVFVYSNMDVYCYDDASYDKVLAVQKISNYIYTCIIGVIPVSIFVCFILSLIALQSTRGRAPGQSNQKPAVTITVFTAVFLICNLPNFLNMAFYNVLEATGNRWPGPLEDNRFIMYYSWNLSAVFTVILNSTINPIVYFSRMVGLRKWSSRICKGVPVNDNNFSMSYAHQSKHFLGNNDDTVSIRSKLNTRSMSLA